MYLCKISNFQRRTTLCESDIVNGITYFEFLKDQTFPKALNVMLHLKKSSNNRVKSAVLSC